MERYLIQHIYEDLKEKMVFIGGPRQVGKTTLSLQVASHFFTAYEYVNWDVDKDREKILKLLFSPDTKHKSHQCKCVFEWSCIRSAPCL